MKAINSITNLLYMAVMALLIAVLTGFSAFAVFVVMFLLATFIPMPKGTAMMALQKEIWVKDILDNLFKDNEFAKRAYNADEHVLAGKVVHIPVAGAPSTVKKNLQAFPQTAVKRTDTEITYAIDTFYSMPRHIEQIEKYELSYDKRQSAMGEDQSNMIEVAMDSLLYRWAPLVANTVLTTGEAALATLDSATGNRKKFHKAEFMSVKKLMDKRKILKTGRIALLTSEHYNDFLDSLSDAEKTNFNNLADMKNGVVGRYLGFDVMMRSGVLRYRGANGSYVVVDELDEAFVANAADRAASLFYQEKCVERAKGEVDIFENERNAEYYGDIYSMLLRLGGRQRRALGVYAVVEDLAA